MIDMNATQAIPCKAKQFLDTAHRLTALTAIAALSACGGGADAPLSAAAAGDSAQFADGPATDLPISKARALALAPAPEPLLWVRAAGENQSFSIDSPTEVRYGVGTKWIQRRLEGTVPCTNSFFGSDPARGVVKTCEISPAPPPMMWVKAVGENQTFSVNEPTEVRYGVETKWIQSNLSGNVNCTNSFFGRDPAPGVVKTCQIFTASVNGSAPESNIWAKAGAENQTFNVNGQTEVRYGAGTNWIQRSLNGSVNCTNSFFGRDPVAGVAKTCQILTASVISSVPAPVEVPAPEQAPAPVAMPVIPFVCAASAITCVEIASTSGVSQASVPVTFGQPFRAGDWKHTETGLIARDNFNQAVLLQADEVSSHRDGSARFAVLSAQITGLQANERRIVNIYKGAASPGAAALPANPTWGMEVVATIVGTQVTKVKFGDRSGTTAGKAFLEGEKIFLKLSNTTGTQTFTHTVTSAQAGGGFATLTLIAETFMKLINSQSTDFVAEKIGTGGGYESLWIKTRNPAGGAFQIAFVYGGAATISQTNTAEFEAPNNWVFRPQDMLKQQIAASNNGQAVPTRRMHGTVASEFALSAPLKDTVTGAEHPHLTARLDTRLYNGGTQIRTDVVLENNWTFKANPKNITYELTVKQNGTTVYHQPVFTHYHHARWHKAVWAGAEPKIQLRHHMGTFMDSRAVWNYDRTLTVSDATLEAEATQLASKRAAQAALGPMGSVFLQTMFGTTGGRPDIGPLPRWTALYLVTQDERARASMMANADAAAAVPIHYRDENTGQPIDPIAHRTLSVYWNGATIPTSTDPTIWAPDTAHQASFTYVPYLLTGDKFYQDEMMFWASWNVFSLPSGFRSLEKALVNRHQVRGQAWALRSLFEAHAALSDSHPMKSTFRTMLDNNLAYYRQTYVNGTMVSPMGAIQHSTTSTPPWQNDFMGTVISLMAENNEPNARELIDWLSKFNVGRFMSDADGFCAARAPGYYWRNVDTNGAFIKTWADLFFTNYAADVGKPCSSLTITDGYPTSGGGYAAYARGMLGAAANAGVQNGSIAYSKWKSMTPAMDNAFAADPTWAISPR